MAIVEPGKEVDALFYPGRPKWGTFVSGNSITYSFLTALPATYFPGNFIEAIGADSGGIPNAADFNAMDDLQRSAATKALKIWEEVADIKFELRDKPQLQLLDLIDLGLLGDILKVVPGVYNAIAGELDKIIGRRLGFPIFAGDIRFGTDKQQESSGRAYPPPSNAIGKIGELIRDIEDFFDNLPPYIKIPIDIYNAIPLIPDIKIPIASDIVKFGSIKLDVGGDVWINNDYTVSPENESNVIGVEGLRGLEVLIHEIGHALGLKHPGDYNAGGGSPPGPFLPADKDNLRYSIMSYNPVDDFVSYTDPITGDKTYISPDTPMLYDIAAIQALYGANKSIRNDDTTYEWNKFRVATIWDTGGRDTIKADGWSVNLEINLNAGEFSSVGLIKNLGIAFGVTIEDAIGGSGNDILIGNSVVNTLRGGAGNDTLTGGASADTLIGDEGVDTASYKESSIGVLVSLSTGKGMFGDAEGDTLQTIENLEGSEKGDDVLIGDTGDNDLSGLGGKDTISGNAGKDTLHGGAGNDSLYGDDGDDTLYGDADDDLLVGGTGNDFIDGGDGFDTVSYENTLVAFEPPYGVTVNIDEAKDYQSPGRYIYSNPFSGTVTGFDPTLGNVIAKGIATDGLGNTDTLRNLEGIIGSNLDDVLIGNSLANNIQGLAGNDIFVGNAGNDTLDGGDGIDTVSYRLDPAAVIVNLEQNIATDGFGETDTLLNMENVLGSDQDDRITGNIQVNWLFGGNGNDIIAAGGGDDVVYGENDNDTLYGGDGNDYLDGGLGNDVLYGEAGQDTLLGGQENDLLDGGAANDGLFGGLGDDTLLGGAGDDTLTGGSGADLLNGGDGIDTASYLTSLAGIVAYLSYPAYNTGDAQGDTYFSIENLEGSQFGDALFGDSQYNHLWGLGGDDYLDGLGGNDTLEGGLGNDTYKIDTLATTIIEYPEQGIDTVNSSIDYALGANLENLNLLEGTAAFTGIGNELSNTISGNSYSNYIDGGDGNDILYGYAGGDTIFGGNGDDWIVGGNGNDILIGGSGNDTFVYNSITDAGDRITDFTIGSDKIKLTDVVNSSGWQSSNLFTDGFLMTRQASNGMATLLIDPDGRAGRSYFPAPFILFDNVSAAALGTMGNFVV